MVVYVFHFLILFCFLRSIRSFKSLCSIPFLYLLYTKCTR
ncbi:hypothetical protein mEp515_85 [Escherichia phage mEp515]|nr:MAG TPA_asm: hypothetical protein [Caudoviricetes sp.]